METIARMGGFPVSGRLRTDNPYCTARMMKKTVIDFLCLCFLFLALPSVPAWADYYPSAYRIPVNPITPLHKQSKDAIFSLRKVKVNDHGKLGIFPEKYMPAPSIYGHVDEKADWVRDTQFFVGNPYLLAVITSGNKVNAFLPYCNIDSVEYSYGKITETYRGESAEKWFYFTFDYYGEFQGIIRFWFVNAYDAGFKYACIDSSKSVNIDMNYPRSEISFLKSIHSGHEFYHVGHLKKNNISPYDVRATIKLREKNARTAIYVKLWRSLPESMSAKEDFAYVFKVGP
jgi:hypothetical protein